MLPLAPALPQGLGLLLGDQAIACGLLQVLQAQLECQIAGVGEVLDVHCASPLSFGCICTTGPLLE